jgi:hypothetical protein
MDLNKLNKYVEEGWVDTNRHYTLPLTIYNYSRKAQIKNLTGFIEKMV